jgi:Tol biopolymer transport system component
MFDVYVKATDGSTDDRLLWGDDFDKTVSSISPDGKLVYVNRFADATKTDIWVVPLDGGKPALLLGTSETEAQAQVSPDGKWIVYVAGSKVERQVYARPYPRGRSIRVSVDGGDDPSWAPSGREILFTRNGREVFVAPFTSRGDQAEVGTPRHLFDINPVEMSTPQFAWNGDLIIERFVPGTVTKTGIEVTTAWRAKLK